MANNEHVFFLFFVNQHHYHYHHHHHHHHYQTWESLKRGNLKMGVHVVKGARLAGLRSSHHINTELMNNLCRGSVELV